MAGSFRDQLFKEPFRFFGFRIVLGVLTLLIYINIWRPVRIGITEKIVYPQVEYLKQPGAMEPVLRNGNLFIQYNYGERSKQLSYRPGFGFFFLISIIALLFVTSERRPYLILLALQLFATIFAYIFLLWGASGFQTGFVLVDAVSGYLAPALSLALVPLVMRGNV